MKVLIWLVLAALGLIIWGSIFLIGGTVLTLILLTS